MNGEQFNRIEALLIEAIKADTWAGTREKARMALLTFQAEYVRVHGVAGIQANGVRSQASEAAAGEPVAYTTPLRLKRIAEGNRHVDTMWPASMRDDGDIPLYAAPQPASEQQPARGLSDDDDCPSTPASERAAFNAMMRWHLIRMLQAWRYGGDLRAVGMAAFEWARSNDVGKEAFKASEKAVKLAASTAANVAQGAEDVTENRVKEGASEAAAGEPIDYDRVVQICEAHGIGLPVDCVEMVVEIIRLAAPQPASDAIEEGCTPADAKMLRAANHGLADENAMLRRRLRPFAALANPRLSWAMVEYCIDGDPEKQTLQAPQMQRAFNRAADALAEELPSHEPVDCEALDLPDWVKSAKPPAPDQPASEQQAALGWVSVSDRLPESGKTVLATYQNSLGKMRRIRAEYIAPKTREQNIDNDELDGEYDEATDTYYWADGWYECIDNWGDYSHVAVSEGAVTHWMPMPDAPILAAAKGDGHV